MKLYRIVYYILAFSFIWISCEDDSIDPAIEILSPIENSGFHVEKVLIVDAVITDDTELDFVEIIVTYPDGTEETRRIELSGISQKIMQEFDLEGKNSGALKLEITAVDKAGNSITIKRNIDTLYFLGGTINFNVKLQYNGEPVVMFSPFTYPDGRMLFFSKLSFYTSQLKLDETLINEVEFHNLTNDHSTIDSAPNGYNWTISSVIPGSYSQLSFNIGVPQVLNDMDPGDFPSGHPLAKPAENWFSWQSYIFLKVEGKIDLNDDGEFNTSIALHTGSNEALRNINLDYPIQIIAGETTEINLILDIHQLFDGTERIFPIEENPQIHSLTQLDAVLEISDNLIESIDKY